MHYSLVRHFARTPHRAAAPDCRKALHQVPRIGIEEDTRGHTPTGVRDVRGMQLRTTIVLIVAHAFRAARQAVLTAVTSTGRWWRCPRRIPVPTPRSRG